MPTHQNNGQTPAQQKDSKAVANAGAQPPVRPAASPAVGIQPSAQPVTAYENNYSQCGSTVVLADGRVASANQYDDRFNGSFTIWRIEKEEIKCGQNLAAVDEEGDYSSRSCVTFLTVLRNGQLVSVYGRRIKIWDVSKETITCVQTFQGSKKEIDALAVFPDNRIASAAGILFPSKKDECLRGESTINIWEIKGKSAKCIQNFSTNDAIQNMVALPDGRLACAHAYGIKIFDLTKFFKKCTITQNTGLINGLVVLPDGRLVSTHIVSESYGEIVIWEIGSTTLKPIATKFSNKGVSKLCILPDGFMVGNARFSSHIRFWKLDTGECIKALDEEKRAYDLTVLRDGRLVSIGRDGSPSKLWDNFRTYICPSTAASPAPIAVSPNSAKDSEKAADKKDSEISSTQLPAQSALTPAPAPAATAINSSNPAKITEKTADKTDLDLKHTGAGVTSASTGAATISSAPAVVSASSSATAESSSSSAKATENKTSPLPPARPFVINDEIKAKTLAASTPAKNTKHRIFNLQKHLISIKHDNKLIEINFSDDQELNENVNPSCHASVGGYSHASVLPGARCIPLSNGQVIVNHQFFNPECSGSLCNVASLCNVDSDELEEKRNIPQKNVLAVLPDGNLVIRNCHYHSYPKKSKDANDLLIVDIKTWQTIHVLQEHTDYVNNGVIIDGYLATSSYDKTIKIWDLNTWQCLRTIQMGDTPYLIATSLIAFKNGYLATTEHHDGKSLVKIWNIHKDDLCHILKTEQRGGEPTHMALPGNRMIVGPEIFDIETGLCIATLSTSEEAKRYNFGNYSAYALLPNGNLVTGMWNGMLEIWDINTGKRIKKWRGSDKHIIRQLLLLQNGNFASADDNYAVVKIWNPESEEPVFVLEDSCSPLTESAGGQLISKHRHALPSSPWKFQKRALTLVDIQPILEALKTNTSVQTLNLQNVILEDATAIPVLIDLLAKNTTLTTLDLRNTGLTPQGIETLQKAIANRVKPITIFSGTMDNTVIIAAGAQPSAQPVLTASSTTASSAADYEKVPPVSATASASSSANSAVVLPEKKADPEKQIAALAVTEQKALVAPSKQDAALPPPKTVAPQPATPTTGWWSYVARTTATVKSWLGYRILIADASTVAALKKVPTQQQGLKNDVKVLGQHQTALQINQQKLAQQQQADEAQQQKLAAAVTTVDQKHSALQSSHTTLQSGHAELQSRVGDVELQQLDLAKDQKELKAEQQRQLQKLDELFRGHESDQKYVLERLQKSEAELQKMDAQTLQTVVGHEQEKQHADLERDHILKNRHLREYYYLFLTRFLDAWLACKVIHSGKVDNSEKNKLDYFTNAFNKASEYISLPGVALIKDILNSGPAAYSAREKQLDINAIANFFSTLQDADTCIETLARRMTLAQRKEIIKQAAPKTGFFQLALQHAKSLKDWIKANDVDTPIKKFAEGQLKLLFAGITDRNPITRLREHPRLNDDDLNGIMKKALKDLHFTYQSPIAKPQPKPVAVPAAPKPTPAPTPVPIAQPIAPAQQLQSQPSAVVSVAKDNDAVSKQDLKQLADKVSQVIHKVSQHDHELHRVTDSQEKLTEKQTQLEKDVNGYTGIVGDHDQQQLTASRTPRVARLGENLDFNLANLAALQKQSDTTSSEFALYKEQTEKAAEEAQRRIAELEKQVDTKRKGGWCKSCIIM